MGGDDQHFQLTLRAANLVPVTRGFFGGSRTNPMFKLSAFQMGQAEPFYVVYESETVDGNLNPQWKTSSTSQSLFGDAELPVMISVYDKQPNSETPIGTVETSLSEIQRKVVGDTDQVDSSKAFKLKDAAGKDVGFIIVVAARIVDPEAEPLEPEPEPEPELPEPPAIVPSTPQSTLSLNSTESRRGSDTSTLLEMAKMQQAIKELTRRADKLDKETSDLRHENKDLKDRVKYLENSLKQDRKLMEMAQKDIAQLQQQQRNGLTLNGSKHSPQPDILDGDLVIPQSGSSDGGLAEMDDKSGKSKSSRHHHHHHSSSPKNKGSDHKSTSTLSTIDSDDKSKSSKSDNKTSSSSKWGAVKTAVAVSSSSSSSPRRGSATSLASKTSTRSGKSSKSPTRSMRRTRSNDGDTKTSSSSRSSRRPGTGSSSRDRSSSDRHRSGSSRK